MYLRLSRFSAKCQESRKPCTDKDFWPGLGQQRARNEGFGEAYSSSAARLATSERSQVASVTWPKHCCPAKA